RLHWGNGLVWPFTKNIIITTIFLPSYTFAMPTPVNSKDHIFKNIGLISLSFLFLPLDTFILGASLFWGAAQAFLFLPTLKPIRNEKRKTVLVNSLAMAKGLCLARAFHLAG